MVSAIFTKENNFCYFGWPPFQNGVYSLENLLQEKQILSYFHTFTPFLKRQTSNWQEFLPWKCIPFTSMERSLFLNGKDIKLWESKFFPCRAASFRKQSQLMGKPIIWCESCLSCSSGNVALHLVWKKVGIFSSPKFCLNRKKWKLN